VNTPEAACAAARTLKNQRYPDAAVLFAAGSIIRGEGTAYSDLDLVVIYEQLPCAYRESFCFQAFPVEAFVHDPETLQYFFVEVDARSGVPALPQMVQEGIEIPEASTLSQALKTAAASVIDAGPPTWTAKEEAKARYGITDLVDDLRAPRSQEELTATGADLYQALANYWCRSNGRWSATGKSIPRHLERLDGDFYGRFTAAFNQLFQARDPLVVIALVEAVLAPNGGLLFEGHRLDAPAAWRVSNDGKS
jgi:hypothetical protein